MHIASAHNKKMLTDCQLTCLILSQLIGCCYICQQITNEKACLIIISRPVKASSHLLTPKIQAKEPIVTAKASIYTFSVKTKPQYWNSDMSGVRERITEHYATREHFSRRPAMLDYCGFCRLMLLLFLISPVLQPVASLLALGNGIGLNLYFKRNH